MSGLLYALPLSLGLTLLLETAFFWLTGRRDKKDLLLLALVNVMTNPAAVLLYWLAAFYTSVNVWLIKLPLELAAALAEGWYYRKYGRSFKRPYLFSLGANIFSFGIGVLLL